MKQARMLFLIMLVGLTSCDDQTLNNPHPLYQKHSNIFYSSFAERPKTLDPARSYSNNETQFVAQVYEPLLQYHYLLRPVTLIPLSSEGMPEVRKEKIDGREVTIYRLHIQRGHYYAPHAAFAKDEKDDFLYHHINETYINEHRINALSDFKQKASRELMADDYIYEIKRLANPKTQSPILGLMNEHIDGLKEYSDTLHKAYQQFVEKNGEQAFFDLRAYPLKGVKKIDDFTFEITLKDDYPQFKYWLAMPFFAPIPWEADAFYSQPGMADQNITLDWYPIGTGPYELTENNPNSEMVLSRNPNYHLETYPSEGMPGDKERGLLEDSGKRLPLVDEAVFRLEKEAVPRWNKFLQGYYDNSGISSDSFDQAISIDAQGKPHLTQTMLERKIKLNESVGPSIYYLGFNMQDEMVGGHSIKAKKLRQAISIALDYDEYVSIFLNGRGIAAQSPIPPGIYGYQEGAAGLNPVVYHWQHNQIVRRDIEDAKKLLVEAGYTNGRDLKTGEPLVLHYDVAATSGPDEKSQFDWMRKEFGKLGIQLDIRATQYNRFQEKMRTGHAQIYMWGWLADYPDPENFLFLLYGPNGKVKFQGENASNYQNDEYDQLYLKMKVMPNGPERQAVIEKMLALIREDSPWAWGFHAKSMVLSHQWNRVTKPSEIANNTLKYVRIDPLLRDHCRTAWNQPKWWPLVWLAALLFIIFIPVVLRYKKQEYGHRS